MNCNHNCGGQVRMPGLTQPPCPPRQPNMNQRPGSSAPCSSAGQARPGTCAQQPVMPASHHHHHGGPGPVISESSCGCGTSQVLSPSFDQNNPKFPVGMGYVPWQNWETPYPLAQALNRGTIFSALDLPFMMGRCRR